MSAGPREQTTEPLRDKLAQVLSEHMLFEYYWGVDGDCVCGFRTPKSYDFAAHSDHVAAAVVAQLGLTEETRDRRIPGGSMRQRQQSRRWVSGWSVVPPPTPNDEPSVCNNCGKPAVANIAVDIPTCRRCLDEFTEWQRRSVVGGEPVLPAANNAMYESLAGKLRKLGGEPSEPESCAACGHTEKAHGDGSGRGCYLCGCLAAPMDGGEPT